MRFLNARHRKFFRLPLSTNEPDMLADLIVFDLNQPRFAGLWEPQSAPLICGEPIDAKHVIINGQ